MLGAVLISVSIAFLHAAVPLPCCGHAGRVPSTALVTLADNSRCKPMRVDRIQRCQNRILRIRRDALSNILARAGKVESLARRQPPASCFDSQRPRNAPGRPHRCPEWRRDHSRRRHVQPVTNEASHPPQRKRKGR